MEILIVILLMISGASYGITQGISFHYNRYSEFNLNPLFWNPEISWKNKYKIGSTTEPAFWGSTTIFVWLTDAYHLFGMISRFILIASIVFIPIPEYSFFESIAMLIGVYGSWIIGFHITYR